MNLSDLPTFIVDAVNETDGELRVSGRLSHLRGVRRGRSWLYVSAQASIIGELDAIEPGTRRAIFVTSDGAVREPFETGASFPWIEGFWQPYQVAMIADSDHAWARTDFAPGPARHFTVEGVHGWQPAGAPLPEGATDLGVRPGDWDHEHCEICQEKIGAGGAATGFRDPDNHWLCEVCYGRYAAPHDLSFLAGT